MTRPLRLLVGALLTIALVVAGCSDDDTAGPTPDADPTTTSSSTSSSTTTSSIPESTTTTAGAGSAATTDAGVDRGDGCWVHLYEDEDFEEDDDHHRLTEPGRYADLRDLPGATDDWTDEAESIRVGPDATVTIWSDTDFRGSPLVLEPGSERADLDDEPESLELTC